MGWIKAIFAIAVLVGALVFLVSESIAEVSVTDKGITISEMRSESVTYEQLLQYKKQLEDAIASVAKKQAELEVVNTKIAQIEAEKAKVVKEAPKVVNLPLFK